MMLQQNSDQDNQQGASNQKGVVLFIALIALVVMSLAAVALIRSVDTNTIIAGNLSFKQSAVVSADRGIETAITWAEATALDDPTRFYDDEPGNGYYATFDEDNTAGLNLDAAAVLRNDTTWNNFSAPATGVGITVAGLETASQNTIRYIIQRMCRDDEEPSDDICQLAGSEIGTSSKGAIDYSNAGGRPDQDASPLYRVTVRVTGPKNTVSYTQAYVY